MSASAHSGPKDSTVIGTKISLIASSLYFATLHADDCVATNPAETDEIAAYDGAIVSTIVTSKRSQLLADHGIKVLPSGRLRSVLVNPDGSLTVGISARQQS